ncbi:MAG: exosortase-associated EpsI family protein [Armatimonadia bacterium]|nr:exosortase-associated EpsI family protein [Armatimonadia bacterium]
MRPNATGHLVGAAVLLVGIIAAPMIREMRPKAVEYHVDLGAVPMQVGDLEGTVLPEDEGVQAYLEADTMKTIAYGEPPEMVTLSVIYGGSWRTVHSPAQCYPAAGWQVVWERDAVVPVAQDLPHPKPVLGRLMRVELEDSAQLVLFIFAHKGGTAIDYAEHAWAVQTGPKGAGGLSLMFSAPVFADEDKTQGRLMEIASAVYPPVIGFWYEDWEPSQG